MEKPQFACPDMCEISHEFIVRRAIAAPFDSVALATLRVTGDGSS
jgi:hypothetical protein